MNPGDIYLGLPGQEIKLPDGSRKVTPIYQEITRTERASNGRLVEDVIRRYINYQIDYEIMTGPDHEIFENLYALGKFLNLIIVNRSGSQMSQMVKMTWTPGQRESIVGNWLWNGVSIMLEAI